MKKTIVNPEWKDAQYELRWAKDGKMLTNLDPYPKRCKDKPPFEALENSDTMLQWVIDNEVPQFIEVDEENHSKP